MNDYLAHVGTPHEGMTPHSGRYAWGSGENPSQRPHTFLENVEKMRAKGLTDTEIAAGMNMSTTEFRARNSIAKAEARAARDAAIRKMTDEGLSNSEIGRRLGINESSVRAAKASYERQKTGKTQLVADVLKQNVDKKNYIDIGLGSELDLGCSRTRLQTAVQMLKEEGYQTMKVYVDQMGTNHKTTIEVLVKPGVDYKTVYANRFDIKPIDDHISKADGKSIVAIKPPVSISSDRVAVRYAEEGGKDKDGVMEIRRGVKDLDLGNAHYAQVRIGVDGTHYLKGMAIYTDDLPKGVDVIFNTNKHKGTPMLGDKDNTVLKLMKDDKLNPFGAAIKPNGQYEYVGDDGKKHLGAINKVNEEGDWGDWSKTLASQFLSKQNIPLIKRQLSVSYLEKKDEIDEIMALTNPTVKKKMLEGFASDCDASAVHLKAAALPRQSSNVILPVPSLKENEIFAPNYHNGEKVCLVRYPHGGTFEIPELIVNNKNKEALGFMSNARDAVGIHPKAASILSGADFDGDTVIVLPTDKSKIKTSKLKGLENFDPSEAYPGYEGMPEMKDRTKQNEMGKITNLITDMTLLGAKPDELARAVRHSMVVIDAQKHNLNYKQSFIDNDIKSLKEKYQNGGGASTIISRANATTRVPERKEINGIIERKVNPETGKAYGNTDPKTGKLIFEETGRTYDKLKKNADGTYSVSKSGLVATQEVTRMSNTDDARTLISKYQHPKEILYADYANKLKSLANDARKEYLATKEIKRDPEMAKKYADEVKSLDAKLIISLKNAPRERQAQLLANSIVISQVRANPGLKEDKDKYKKIKGRALTAAREAVGAKKQPVIFTDREWEAVQNGAISSTKLSQLLNNAKDDHVKALATPRNKREISQAKISRIKALEAAGYSQAEIAKAVGVSTSSVNDILYGARK